MKLNRVSRSVTGSGSFPRGRYSACATTSEYLLLPGIDNSLGVPYVTRLQSGR